MYRNHYIDLFHQHNNIFLVRCWNYNIYDYQNIDIYHTKKSSEFLRINKQISTFIISTASCNIIVCKINYVLKALNYEYLKNVK